MAGMCCGEFFLLFIVEQRLQGIYEIYISSHPHTRTLEKKKKNSTTLKKKKQDKKLVIRPNFCK